VDAQRSGEGQGRKIAPTTIVYATSEGITWLSMSPGPVEWADGYCNNAGRSDWGNIALDV
jgi:hypothetical protein